MSVSVKFERCHVSGGAAKRSPRTLRLRFIPERIDLNDQGKDHSLAGNLRGVPGAGHGCPRGRGCHSAATLRGTCRHQQIQGCQHQAPGPRRGPTPRPSTTCSPTRSTSASMPSTSACCWAATTPSGTARRRRRDNILKALQWVSANAKAKDPVIFAFVGNGGPLGDSGDRRCLLRRRLHLQGPRQGRHRGRRDRRRPQEAEEPAFMAFLDVDFKGFVGDGRLVEPAAGKSPYKEFLGDDGSEDHAPLPGRVVFLATNGLSASLDLKDHGLFTHGPARGPEGGSRQGRLRSRTASSRWTS